MLKRTIEFIGHNEQKAREAVRRRLMSDEMVDMLCEDVFVKIVDDRCNNSLVVINAE